MDDPAGRLVGWPHHRHEAVDGLRPTAFGTGYGLRLALLIGDRDTGLDVGALAETLWRIRLPDGGWAARTQSGVSRPEATALVLGALSSCGGDPARVAQAADAVEAALAPGADPVAAERTYIVTAAMRGLLRIRPQSVRLLELRGVLLAGAVKDPEADNLLCWSVKLADQPSPLVTRPPSTVHTAQAVVAMVRSGRARPLDPAAASAVEQAVRWLIRRGDLANSTEQIRRELAGIRPESLTVKHFTAAWVARALMAGDATALPGGREALEAAVRLVWASRAGALWQWERQDEPLWMTYQGLSVVRDYVLEGHPWP
jgi:hypothetical protein